MKQIPANRTGIDASPLAADMKELMDIARPSNLARETIAELEAKALAKAPPVGSPPPAPDAARRFLLDQMAARLAFERAGTRLYEQVLRKAALAKGYPDGPDLVDLERFRAEEHGHFVMLHGAIRALGGDPTAVSPSADLDVTCSLGLLQAVTDPRLDLGETLSAMLVAELTDNDAWNSLIDLARAAGQDDLADSFAEAEGHEADHLAHVRAWVAAYRGWRLDGNGERGGASGVVATAVAKGRKAKAVAKRRLVKPRR